MDGANIMDNRDGDVLRNRYQYHQPSAVVSRSPPLFWIPEVMKEGGVRGGASTSRLLSEPRGSSDGTLAVLMIVCALFCFIWAPVMLRRCRGQGSHQRAQEDIHDLARFEAEARAMRAALQRMTLMGTVLSGGAVGSSGSGLHGEGSTAEEAQQLEHRRDFLDNALLTKKVLFQSEDEHQKAVGEESGKESGALHNTANDDNNTNANTLDKEAANNVNKKGNSAATDMKTRKTPRRQKSNVIVVLNTTKHSKTNTLATDKNPKEDGADKNDKEGQALGDEEVQHQQQSSSLEPCSICLADYDDGDDICWSQNDKCNHFFHKECIQTWLLTHEECPCCRQDFLHLWGDEDDDEVGGGHQLRRQSTGSGAGAGLIGRSSRRHFSDGSNFDLRSNSFFGPSVSDSLRSSAAAGGGGGGGGRTRGRRDWVEELAVEIQDRILERQRELQVEFYRREQEERQRQFVSSLMMAPQPSAASLNHHNGSLQVVGSPPVRNSTHSTTEDTAPGWLLYRHFPFNNFGGDSRRRRASNANLDDNADDEGRHSGEDVQVADLSLPRGLEPWQTYSSDDRDPVISSPTGARTPSFFEMVERSTRRLGEERLPPRRQSQPTPIRFLNAGRESSNRFMRRSSSTSREPTPSVTNAVATRANAGATTESAQRRNRDPASRSVEDVSARTDPDDDEILNSADA